jgi:5-methylcytosine-specific restriction endonuclease McrA
MRGDEQPIIAGRASMKPAPYQRIYERDNWKCQYCGLDASEDFETWWTANLNIDHIKPKHHGGNNNDENLAVACRACNTYKGRANFNSKEEARDYVQEKREEAIRWFNKYVVKKVN